MTITEYEKLSELEHYKQEILRQQFKNIIDSFYSALKIIKVDKVYFKIDNKIGYQLRPIFKEKTDQQEWQKIQSEFEADKELKDVLLDILKQLSINNNFAQEKSADEINEIEEPAKDEILRTTPSTDYFNYCHNYVAAVTGYLLNVGLYLYIDELKIGYDTMTKELILPIDEKNYHAIKLKFDRAADEEQAAKVLRHYNLKPHTTAKSDLIEDEEGKLHFYKHNNKKPYKDDSPYSEKNCAD